MMMRVFASCFFVALLLAGCERTSPPRPQAAPESVTEDVAAAARWALEAGADDASLSVLGADATLLFRIACVRSPARMEINVPGFALVGSEERLTFGVDDEAFAFVADVVGRPASGVRAEAPINVDLLDRFARTSSVTAVYGAATAGPYLSPPPAQSEAFVAACRDMVG